MRLPIPYRSRIPEHRTGLRRLRAAGISFLTALCLLTLAAGIAAAKYGRACLKIQYTQNPQSPVSAGDILPLEVYVEGNGEPITGVVIFLTFDDTYLELIPEVQRGESLFPFQQGDLLEGTVFNNETLSDRIGDSSANRIPGFQLYYFENISLSFTGEQRAVVGSGVVARVRLRVLRETAAPLSAVQIDLVSPDGSETGYFVKNDPGTLYRFDAVETRAVTKTLPADFNADARTDFQDFLLFSRHFGLSDASPDFDPIYDLDGSRTVDFGDFLLFIAEYGRD